MSAPNNPAAFPCVHDRHLQEGMSQREYFAAAALPAIITATSRGEHQPGFNLEGATMIERIAHDAYAMADAMLKPPEPANHARWPGHDIDAGFLVDLASRIFEKCTPAQGCDQGDTDKLVAIARRIRGEQ
jgi:hypothetical protein